jgi:Nuclease-related domain/UvrD-like helicase C-terminal domain
MAMMIPSFIDPDTAPGEIDVYNMLANGPDEWVVFHQVDLSSTIRRDGSKQCRREIDFLIVIPMLGILCIEVKSHENIHFDGKFWYPNTIKQDPFKQSLNALKALERHLKLLGQELGSIPLGRCCIFPRSSFSLVENASINRWEFMDKQLFKSFHDSKTFCLALEESLKKSVEREYGQETSEFLTHSQITKLKSYLCPIQKRKPTLRDQIKIREERAFELLREQQKPILRFAEFSDDNKQPVNPRLIIDGAAGTGKSWLAMEIARRMADSGKRTALVCYNQLVGDWMAANISKDIVRPNLIVGRAIKLLIDITEISIQGSPTEIFWEKDIYDLLEEKITDPEFNSEFSFDYLIIDEAQDILSKPRLFSALMHLLPGGIITGSYCLVGDFKYQLFGNRLELENQLSDIRNKAKGISTFPLTENCRNYSVVGGSAVKLSGIKQKVYDGYMRSGGSIENFKLKFYSSDSEQLDALADVIREYKSIGYDDSDIVILSLVNDDDAVAKNLKKLSFKISPAKMALPNTIRYCTVNSFKGLEAKVVIVTDVEASENEFKRNQLYTALTRSTECVHVLFAETSRKLVGDWL